MSHDKYDSGLPGQEHHDQAVTALRDAGQMPSNHDETNPPADRTIAEAQVYATLAVWEAMADVAAELRIAREQREQKESGKWFPA